MLCPSVAAVLTELPLGLGTMDPVLNAIDEALLRRDIGEGSGVPEPLIIRVHALGRPKKSVSDVDDAAWVRCGIAVWSNIAEVPRARPSPRKAISDTAVWSDIGEKLPRAR